MIRKGHGKIIASLNDERAGRGQYQLCRRQGWLRCYKASPNMVNTTSVQRYRTDTSPPPDSTPAGETGRWLTSSFRLIHHSENTGSSMGNTGRPDGSGYLPGIRCFQFREWSYPLRGWWHPGIYRQTTLTHFLTPSISTLGG